MNTITTYQAGTLTKAVTYSDVGMTVLNTNPIYFDEATPPNIYGPGAFKLVFETDLGEILTLDNVYFAGP